MSIERKCENCFKDFDDCDYCHWCKQNRLVNLIARDLDSRYENRFFPKEELVRADERNKFITLLKSDLENFDGLADDCVERKDIHELLQNNAVRKYIEETIVLLEKEA